MTDYVVAVGFQTDAGTVKRSTDQLAASVERVGQAQGSTARSTKDLTSATAQLERITQRIAIQEKQLAAATAARERMQRAGSTSSKYYTAALEKELVAQDRLATSILRAEKLQKTTAGAAPSAKGGSLGSRFVAGAAGFVTADALAKLATDSIQKAGELRGTLQQNEQIFGASAREVEQIGKNSATALGLSRQAAIDAADQYGLLFRTLHVGQAEAAGMSQSLVRIGTDVAAFSRADPQDVFNAFRMGLNGQFSTLQKYGVFLSTTSVRQEAVRLGLVRGTGAISQAAQATAAYSLIVKQTADRQGQFASSSDNVARQQAITAAKLADAKTQLGQGLIPAYLALADAATHTVIPALTGIAKVIGFIVEHDTTRHITEILLAALAVNKAISLGQAGVDRLTAAYIRLTEAATRATIAEREAAAVATTSGTKVSPTAGIGAGPVVGAITTGLILAQLSQGPEQAVVDDAKRRGGTGGKIEGIVGNVLQDTNALTVFGRAWDLFKAKAKETDQTVSDTVPIDRLGAAFEKAQARIEALTVAQNKANRAVSYSLRASHDSRLLAAAAAAQPIGGLLDAPKSSDVDLTSLEEAVRSARQGVKIAQGRSSGRASPSQIASAEASVAAARAAARKPGGDFDAEQARLRAAEVRLSELRQGGSRDAQAAATSEKGLADARERLRKANKALADGEEQLNGLSAKTVLTRADTSKEASEAEVRNVRTLVRAGLTNDVIEDLKKLEKDAPGTIANVAKALTPAYVRQLNHDAAARRKAAQDLASLGGESVKNDAVRRAQQLARDQAQAYKEALLAAIKDPAWRALLLTELGRLLTPDGVPGVPGSGAPKPPGGKTAPRRLEDILPPGGGGGAAAPSTAGPHTNAIPRDDLRSTSLTTRSASTTPTVHLSTESVAAVGNHVRAGGGTTAQHTNVFPNVSNFPAAINEAERRERRSRIIGG